VNPRQRRGLLLLVLSALAAVFVFVAVLSYVGGVRAEVGDKVPVLKLVRDVPAFNAVADGDVSVVQIPRKFVSAAMVAKIDDLRGMVAATNLHKGSYLETDTFEQPPDLRPGQRELAILIDAETGVAGKVHSGDHVDIYATFSGQNNNNNSPPVAKIIVSNALVINIGNLQGKENNGNSNFSSQQVVPVTFALSVHDSLVLAYAESFAAKVRLALISGLDRQLVAETDRTFTQALQPTDTGTPAPPGSTVRKK